VYSVSSVVPAKIPNAVTLSKWRFFVSVVNLELLLKGDRRPYGGSSCMVVAARVAERAKELKPACLRDALDQQVFMYSYLQ
jgi:hypothetical protein